MSSFLRLITSNEIPRDSLNYYIFDFFSKHLDIETVKKLLNTKLDYMFLIDKLQKRYDKTFTSNLEANKEQLSSVTELLDKIFALLKTMETKRIDLSNKLLELYDEDSYDSDLASKLEEELASIAKEKKDVQFNLNKQMDKKKSLLGQKEKNDKETTRMNNGIESDFNRLKKHLAEIDLSNMDLFGCFTSKEILAEFEKGLQVIIPDENIRRTFLSYFYNTINKEVEALKDAVLEADSYTKTVDKIKDYNVENMQSKQSQIVTLDNMLTIIGANIQSYFPHLNEEKNYSFVQTALDAYTDSRSHIEAMIDYVMNYNMDPIADNKKYKEIRKKSLMIEDKNEAKRPKILGVINKKGVSSTASFAYEDLAMKVYEFMSTMNPDLKKANLNEENKKSNKFKTKKEEYKENFNDYLDNSLGVEILKQPTDEELNMLSDIHINR